MIVCRTRAASLGLCLAFSLTLLPPMVKRSEATVAIIATANPATDITLAFIPVYYLVALSGGMATLETFKEASRTGNPWKYVQAALMATFGVIALEQNAAGSADFGPIDAPSALAAGMTSQEHSAYLAELPQLNALREEILLRVESRLSSQKRTPSNIEIGRSIQSEWNRLAPETLSPAAKSALEKMGSALWRH